MASTLSFIVEHARTPGERSRAQQGARGFRLRLPTPSRTDAPARPRGPGAGPDGHADPAVPGADRPGQRQYRRAQREPARGLQRDGRRADDRRRRLRALALARPHVRPGPLRPPVCRAPSSAIRDPTGTPRARHDLRHPRTPAAARTAPATRSTASSTCSTSGSCCRSRSCSPRCPRCTWAARSPATACTPPPPSEIQIQPGQTVAPLPKPGARTIGRGTAGRASSTGWPTASSSTFSKPPAADEALTGPICGTSSAARSR